MPKKKYGKYLQFYMDCMKNQEMPKAGLCCCSWTGYIEEKQLDLFIPSGVNPFAYWCNKRKDECPYKFNKLRQTIVLFMAAINGEL